MSSDLSVLRRIKLTLLFVSELDDLPLKKRYPLNYFIVVLAFLIFDIGKIDYTIDHLVKAVNRLRDISPLWEMVQEGIDLKTIQWSQH